MPISWGQLPLEMRQEVVKEMAVGTRVNLSMCSKSDNQLVRGTKYGKLKEIICGSKEFVIIFDSLCTYKDVHRVLVKQREDGGSMVFVIYRYPTYWVYGASENPELSTTAGWRETILNIMSLIGTKITVDCLTLDAYGKFNEMFKWLRKNVTLNPKRVNISVDAFSDHYDESVWVWPSYTKIDIHANGCRLPNLERFNMYDRINSFCYWGDWRVENEDTVTDEDLKKLRNATCVYLSESNVTINKFCWWIKEWMTRTNDKEPICLYMRFKEGQETSLQTLTNALSGFIEKINRCIDDPSYHAKDYWKIEIKKNEKTGGTIKLSNNDIEFKSNIIMA